jgi:diguanylate cyclase (GGDEF)-like protein
MPNTHYSDAEIAAALEACAREPVHIPGAIQPVGCLVSLDADVGRIRRVSANIEAVLGIGVDDALAGEPEEVLGTELLDRLGTELLGQDRLDCVLTARREVLGEQHRFHVVAYHSGDSVVVELEYQMCPDGHRLLDKVNDWLVEVGKIDDIDTLLDALTRRVQELTGHERVMVYRFDEKWNGRVVAETRLLHGIHDSQEILSDERGAPSRTGWPGPASRGAVARAAGCLWPRPGHPGGEQWHGALPADENMIAMADWPSRHQRHDTPWHTQALGGTPLAPWQEEDLCGLLAVALPSEPSHWLMLFRREQRHSRRWAGKPEDTPMLRDGQLILTPRRSFAQWQEEITGYSRAWRAIKYRAAGDLAKSLAVLTSSHAIANLNERLHHANRKLESLAYSDSLTGTWNRYRMEKAIDAELNAAERHDRPFAVLLFDVDHFKHFNDTHGHETGDQVLVTLCRVLQNILRPTDNLGRWGGEEFIVLATDCDLIGGVYLAERLRQGTEKLDLGHLGKMTISIGVATWRPGDSRKALIARADQAMYRAKVGAATGWRPKKRQASFRLLPEP